MPFHSRRNRLHDGDEQAGWIAMADVFSLFAVVAIGVGGAQIAKLVHDSPATPGDWAALVRERGDIRMRLELLEVECVALRAENLQLTDDCVRLKLELEAESESSAGGRASAAALLLQVQELLARLEESAGKLAVLADFDAQMRRRMDERGELVGRIAQLEAEVAASRREVEALNAKLRDAKNDYATQLAATDRLRLEGNRLQERINAAGKGEAGLRRQLLGLEGELHRVVFVLDRSSSMDVKDSRTGRNRWRDTVDTIDAWLRYLAVDSAALVVFSSGVDVFPPDGRWIDVAHDGAGALLEGLNGLTPRGGTNTLGALKRAYQYPGVETIILFTDGAPDVDSSGDGGSAEDIFRFVANQQASGRRVTIHTVGVGDYFSARMSEFLLRLSGDTGGTFIGR
ncbi:MAG: VWA domain-containing protein [Phycisphaerales bacterium]